MAQKLVGQVSLPKCNLQVVTLPASWRHRKSICTIWKPRMLFSFSEQLSP